LLSSKQDLIEAGHPFAVAKDDIESFISEEAMNDYLDFIDIESLIIEN